MSKPFAQSVKLGAYTPRVRVVVALNEPEVPVIVSVYCPTGAVLLNMAVFGAYVGRTQLATKDSVLEAIRHSFASKPRFIDVNCRTFLRGYELAAQA